MRSPPYVNRSRTVVVVQTLNIHTVSAQKQGGLSSQQPQNVGVGALSKDAIPRRIRKRNAIRVNGQVRRAAQQVRVIRAKLIDDAAHIRVVLGAARRRGRRPGRSRGAIQRHWRARAGVLGGTSRTE